MRFGDERERLLPYSSTTYDDQISQSHQASWFIAYDWCPPWAAECDDADADDDVWETKNCPYQRLKTCEEDVVVM